jgi:2-oxoglutarate ferredoxin oxidoreductase subunit alpha
VRECFELTIDAVNLSERYRTPVVLLMDEVIGHMRESVTLPSSGSYNLSGRAAPESGLSDYCPFGECDATVAPLAAFGGEYRFHVTGLTHDAHGFPTMVPSEVDWKIRHIVGKIESRVHELASYEEFMTDDADVLLFAYGSTARVAKAAVRSLRGSGERAGLLRTRTIWPFSDQRLKELAPQLKLVVVPELNLGQIVLEVERALCGSVPVARLGRVDGHLFEPDDVTSFVEKEVGR